MRLIISTLLRTTTRSLYLRSTAANNARYFSSSSSTTLLSIKTNSTTRPLQTSSPIQTLATKKMSTTKTHRPIVATADLCDDYVTSPDRLKVANPFPKFYNYGKITSFFGEIYTVRCFESNPLVRQTLSSPGNGRVLVVDGGASTRVALMGDMLAKFAHDNNWAGVVINGCIRDSKVIGEMDVGVKALGTHPLKSSKKHTGEDGVTVSFAGVEFVPGHWLYSDEDGIVISEKPLHTPSESKL